MNETYVTLQGWLGGEVTLRQVGETPVGSFRVASTPRRYQRRTDSWVDGEVQWYTVNTWRALADHCAQSLRRGDPVVVHGKLTSRTWTGSTGVPATSLEVEASFVGHDLTRGVTRFSRMARPADPGAVDTVGQAAQTDGPDQTPDPDSGTDSESESESRGTAAA